MAVPACGRCVRGGRPRGGVSPPGLPGVRRAAGVLVRVPASCPRGGQVRADLCSPAALRAVRGEPCAAAVVRAGLAAGYGRDGRRGAGRGLRRRVRGAPGRGTGGRAVYDGPGLGAPVRRARPGDRGRVRGAGGRAGRAGDHRASRGGAVRAGRDRRGVRRGCSPAGLGRAGRVAVRVSGDRREADRGQHNLALPDCRQQAFHASCPAITGRKENGMDRDEQEQVALHRWAVIAEAAGEKLAARERGALVRQIATRSQAHPDGSQRTYSRGTIDRWLRAWRAGGLNALKPAERSDTGTARAHPELFAEAAAHSSGWRSEEHTSELQSPIDISYAVFCLKKKNKKKHTADTGYCFKKNKKKKKK